MGPSSPWATAVIAPGNKHKLRRCNPEWCVVLMALLALGMKRDPHDLPCALLGKPAPAFRLPEVEDEARLLDSQALRGRVWMLNVWASWCRSCLQEHALLKDFAKRAGVPIVGLNHKDDVQQARQWLRQHGNAWATSGQDRDGRVGMDWGVYGVPETFVIDAQGRVRLRHAGPLTQDVLQRQVLPLLEALQSG